jgi:hypothetical protein
MQRLILGGIRPLIERLTDYRIVRRLNNVEVMKPSLQF